MKKQIILFFAILMSNSFFAQQEATINIVGHASKMVTPDKAQFFISIRASKKTEPESYKAMTEISNEILNRLKKEGFTESNIKLTDYSVQMEFDYSTGKAKKTGYVSSQNLTVKFPIDKRRILNLYDHLTANEMEGVSINFSTECSDSLKNKIQNDLIVLALNDAKEKANLIATTTDCKIKSVADVSYKIAANVIYPQAMVRSYAMKATNDSGTQASDFFSINETEFSEDIKVTYWIQSAIK
jgi:uncharacterized protein